MSKLLLTTKQSANICFTIKLLKDNNNMYPKNYNSIILCGFMACGKSVLGKNLAARLKLPYLDTDELISLQHKMSIPEIFAKEGEAKFRDYEKAAAEYIVKLPPHVIAGGGGMLAVKKNAEILKSSNIIIHIDRDFKTIFDIISKDKNRPLAYKKDYNEIKKLYTSRIGLYRRNSHFSVNNSGAIKDCVESILSKLSDFN